MVAFTQPFLQEQRARLNMIHIAPTTGPFGAMVGGFDLRDTLDQATLSAIRSGLRAHLLLVFRGHAPLSDAQLLSFAAALGEVGDFGSSDKARPGSVLDRDGVAVGARATAGARRRATAGSRRRAVGPVTSAGRQHDADRHDHACIREPRPPARSIRLHTASRYSSSHRPLSW